MGKLPRRESSVEVHQRAFISSKPGYIVVSIRDSVTGSNNPCESPRDEDQLHARNAPIALPASCETLASRARSAGDTAGTCDRNPAGADPGALSVRRCGRKVGYRHPGRDAEVSGRPGLADKTGAGLAGAEEAGIGCRLFASDQCQRFDLCRSTPNQHDSACAGCRIRGIIGHGSRKVAMAYDCCEEGRPRAALVMPGILAPIP